MQAIKSTFVRNYRSIVLIQVHHLIPLFPSAPFQRRTNDQASRWHTDSLVGLGNGTGDAKKTAIESGAIALGAGIRHIDTAQGYHNEVETGNSLLNSSSSLKRDDVYVTTKISQKDGNPGGPPMKIDDVRDSIHTSVRQLGFMPNLILIHSPFVPEPGKLVEFWKILEDMKDRGELTSSLGVSNFRPQDLDELLKVAKHKPVVNQLEFHPFTLVHLEPVLAICAQHGIKIESYGGLSPILRHPSKGGPLAPLLDTIAARLSKASGEEVDQAGALLQWLKAKDAVAVTASGNEARIKKLAVAQNLPDLTKEEVEEIDTIGKKIHYRHYDEHMSIDFPLPDLPSDF